MQKLFFLSPNENFDVSEVTIYKESKLPYLEKKIFHLVNSGFNNDIDKLIANIPLDFKQKSFDEKNFYTRLQSFDIPHVCNNISQMLSSGEDLTFFRKTLIVCKFVLKKQEEAMLALELLENDIEVEDKFVYIKCLCTLSRRSRTGRGMSTYVTSKSSPVVA